MPMIAVDLQSRDTNKEPTALEIMSVGEGDLPALRVRDSRLWGAAICYLDNVDGAREKVRNQARREEEARVRAAAAEKERSTQLATTTQSNEVRKHKLAADWREEDSRAAPPAYSRDEWLAASKRRLDKTRETLLNKCDDPYVDGKTLTWMVEISWVLLRNYERQRVGGIEERLVVLEKRPHVDPADLLSKFADLMTRVSILEQPNGVSSELLGSVAERVAGLGNRMVELETENKELRAELAYVKTRGVEYKGVHVPGALYKPGDMVTHDGCMWACQAETRSDFPGKSGSWILCVKRGREGRDAREAK